MGILGSVFFGKRRSFHAGGSFFQMGALRRCKSSQDLDIAAVYVFHLIYLKAGRPHQN